MALTEWRRVISALEPRAHRYAPIADIWLPALMDELDRRLDEPLQINDDGPVRTITALGFVRYTIDQQARTVSCTMLASKAPVQIDPKTFDVVCAWSRFGWLGPLLSELQAVRVAETVLPDLMAAKAEVMAGGHAGADAAPG
jgi:hypothetical protein